jgi:hypothetical protein
VEGDVLLSLLGGREKPAGRYISSASSPPISFLLIFFFFLLGFDSGGGVGRWCLVILVVATGPAFYWCYKKGVSA